ncbi:hypothetical protein HD806DRAFT_82704 [Xylariaceae sp. AK1471]|nr:hypothetical protein HD806DRAFT_82704 [Xylariaceae sp. AK1471]
MSEAVVFSQCPDDDIRGLTHSLLGVPSEGGGTPMLELPWAYPVEDVRYDPRRSLRNSGGKTFIKSEDVRSYASANDGFDSVSEPVNDRAKLQVPAQGQNVGQMVDGVYPLDTIYFLPAQRHLSAEALPRANQACETTSSKPSQDSPRLARRTTSTSSSSTTPADPSETSPTKQHRESNRIAARKCRQKAKQNISKLQQRERELSQQNRMLLSYVNSLREEILDLKNEILRHSECNSSLIQDYIANAARRQIG